MKKIILLILIITIAFSYNGSITGVTYFDYKFGNEASGFNFNRQYFNYAIHMSNDVKFKVVFDVARINKLIDFSGNSEDTRLVVFLKKAQLDYKSNWGKINLGLIGTNTYAIQEKNWGYRFIEKSALDKNKFVSTADLGIGFSRKIKDDLSISFQLVNGEGYKQAQLDKYQKLSINTIYGEKNLLKNEGFNLGFSFSSENTVYKPISITSIYGGFSLNGLRAAVESSYLTDQDLVKSLFSFSSAYKINSKIDIFYRYDILEESIVRKKFFISGIVYNCGSGLLVSPNLL